ncbi:Uma2 family endonuclease [Thermoleptolyngbya sp. M55_K2018_002]|uniref:Uma2 family endonuclease n=1 Tax=Thermoleptolyngbya sp. M55_K2018_002 TaxID=2747808 RepID=UPI0019E3D9F3|nr:Uma2 family endonuclease [Thermoleptolyngbya sp. M55_K2018_002]HIK43118.1 Uma2 family endonuclease [Thermoleptolyngbya sp. M55_K2018_002]
MVSTDPQFSIPRSALAGERRVTIHQLNWQGYQQIQQALGERRSPRLAYDQGTLELTMPLEEHESFAEWIGLLIRILVEEFGLKMKSIGSTALEYPNQECSVEPDNAYYIQNQAKVSGRRINFEQDPPPDLVVEIDITHTDIDKNRLYASIGVPEFWRFNGTALGIYQLQSQAYVEVEHSPTFPKVPKDKFYEFLQQASRDEVEASRALRAWVRQLQSGDV